jgi:hypothetical protein
MERNKKRNRRVGSEEGLDGRVDVEVDPGEALGNRYGASVMCHEFFEAADIQTS